MRSADTPVASASTVEVDASCLFGALLGASFDSLPDPVRRLHCAPVTRTYRGFASVERGTSMLSRLCGWAARLPPATPDIPIEVEIEKSPECEVWTRCFGPHRMRSRLSRDGVLLRERLGLVCFGFALSARDSVLYWQVRKVRAMGIPLPTAWFGAVQARESMQDGQYRFEVDARLPWVGLLARYQGGLDVPDDVG